MIDIAIVGGGVTGLWLLNRLRSLGYDAHLFEKEAFGSGQTMASQGIIHSGAKYGLAGVDRDPISILSGMPDRWKDCLRGVGEVDLRGCKVLAKEQKLFHLGDAYPFAGEPVLDVRSLLLTLLRPVWQWAYLGPTEPAKLTIWTAGLGNEAVSEAKRRPLRMFMVKPNPFGTPVYIHWTGKNNKPMMTLTTHYLNGEEILYVGGSVAERAVGMGDAESIEWAISEIQYRFPNFNWRKKEWAFVDLVRAENPDGKLSVNWLDGDGSKMVVWPIKLSLAPIVGDLVLDDIRRGTMIQPRRNPTPLRLGPQIAKYPWEVAKWVTP